MVVNVNPLRSRNTIRSPAMAYWGRLTKVRLSHPASNLVSQPVSLTEPSHQVQLSVRNGGLQSLALLQILSDTLGRSLAAAFMTYSCVWMHDSTHTCSGSPSYSAEL